MVIYKYYINEKYNASALNMGMLLLRTWGCCYFPSIVFSIIKG